MAIRFLGLSTGLGTGLDTNVPTSAADRSRMINGGACGRVGAQPVAVHTPCGHTIQKGSASDTLALSGLYCALEARGKGVRVAHLVGAGVLVGFGGGVEVLGGHVANTVFVLTTEVVTVVECGYALQSGQGKVVAEVDVGPGAQLGNQSKRTTFSKSHL